MMTALPRESISADFAAGASVGGMRIFPRLEAFKCRSILAIGRARAHGHDDAGENRIWCRSLHLETCTAVPNSVPPGADFRVRWDIGGAGLLFGALRAQIAFRRIWL